MAGVIRKTLSQAISSSRVVSGSLRFNSRSAVLSRRFFSIEEKKIDKSQTQTITSKEAVQPKDLINENIWAWVPPAASLSETAVKSSYQFEVKKRVPLTIEEVTEYLESNGAENVNVIRLQKPLINITHMIFATASSTRLIRQYGMTIAKNLKDRELKWIIGSTGPEGEPDDDWQCVDCDEYVVHLFTAEAREVMDLETWWTMENRPVLKATNNQEEFEQQIIELTARFPANKNGLTLNVSQKVDATEQDLIEGEKIIKAMEQEARHESRGGGRGKKHIEAGEEGVGRGRKKNRRDNSKRYPSQDEIATNRRNVKVL